MKVYLGADHRGFKMKEELQEWLARLDLGSGEVKYEVEDCGARELDKDDDYVEYAYKVAEKVNDGEEGRGIVLCGSGVGVEVVVNKIDGVRGGLGLNAEQVRAARRDDDINVLAIAADFTSFNLVKEMVEVFLGTEFSGAGWG